MMRVLSVSASTENPDSGAAGTEYQTALALRELGVEVEAIWGEQLGCRIGHNNLRNLLELPFRYRAAVKRECDKRPYDVIMVSQPHGYLAAKMVKRDFPHSVFVHRSHGLEQRVIEALAPWKTRHELDRRSPLRKGLSAVMGRALAVSYRRITEEAYAHVVSASECRDYLVHRCGVAPKRVALVPQGVPRSFRDAKTHPQSHARLKRLLYVGQYALFKGPMLLAEAVTKLLEMEGIAAFTWVCASEHHRDVRALFPESVQNRVAVLPWMSQERLREILDEHGVFLFPSLFEGFGKAFLEAMARGLCVVTSNTGGMRDLISSGGDGIMVEVGDVDGMVNAVRHIWSDVGMACRMSSAATAKAARYTWRASAGQLLRALEIWKSERATGAAW